MADAIIDATNETVQDGLAEPLGDRLGGPDRNPVGCAISYILTRTLASTTG